MNIRYLGHSSFLVTSKKGSKVLTDPYSDVRVKFQYPQVDADILLLSHEHPDHNATWKVSGFPQIIRRTSDYDIEFEFPLMRTREVILVQGFKSHHDKSLGKKYGPNTIYKWSQDGFDIVFLGDLGHVLSDKLIKRIGNVDILFVPVGGGGYTLNGQEASVVVSQLSPTLIFPMHYKTEYASWVAEDYSNFAKVISCDNFDSDNFEFSQLPDVRKGIILQWPQSN